MTGLDGFETATEIRRIAPALPVVMLTSDARAGDTVRSREAGLASYAIKPLGRAALLRVVCGVMKLTKVPNAAGGSDARDTSEPVKTLRILIAEDSADNSLLLQAYMKGSPHQLTFAEDGRVAVDRFATSEFDLILMDMQMPVMDGLTATRAIRAIERERGTASIPIIALSANAHSHDVEMSLSTGCNVHASKPISKQKLLHLIGEYGRRTSPGAIPAVESPRPILIETPLGLENIVPAYLATRRKELPQMIELLAASDFERLTRLAHNIKGTGASYGFRDLTRIGAAIEGFAKQSDPIALGKQLAELKDYLEQVELKPGAPDVPPPDQPKLP